MIQIYRISFFLALALSSVLIPFPLFLFFACIYIFFWDGFELFIITILIDSTFGVSTSSFMYTLSLGALLAASFLLRPYVSWYTTKT